MNYYNYFTEIEEYFVKRRGKHLFVSPVDWSLIATWRASGIPLHVALRGIDIAMNGFSAKTRRSSSKVNSLFYCHDSVMSEHASYLESHVGESSTRVQPTLQAGEARAVSAVQSAIGRPEIMEFLSERISEIRILYDKQFSSRRAPVERIVSRLEDIVRNLQNDTRLDVEALDRDLRILDELLVTELRAILPPTQIEEWEKESKKELKLYKKRLPRETYDKIHDNFIRRKIHQNFRIGELSLFYL